MNLVLVPGGLPATGCCVSDAVPGGNMYSHLLNRMALWV